MDSSVDQYSRSMPRSGSRRPAMVMTVNAALVVSMPAGGWPKNSRARGSSAASPSRLATLFASTSPASPSMLSWSRTSSRAVDSSAVTWRSALRSAVTGSDSRTVCGGSSIMHKSRTSDQRRSLVRDLCMMLLPPQTVRLSEPVTALRNALRQVTADESTALEDVLDQLNIDGDAGDVDAKSVANLLGDAAELPLARLFFGHPPAGMLTTNAALTVITMAGLRLPDLGIEREYWSTEESIALPMLHLAHRLAVRRCYGGDMHARKLVGLDEE